MATTQRAVNRAIPLGLYVHLPWCVRKCPYCDFNSHAPRATPPFEAYVDALLADLDADLRDAGEALHARRIETIFFGGGTPSLFPDAAIARLLDGLAARVDIDSDAEITLEANPGTVEHGRFAAYRAAGINRLSLGAQSFADAQLEALGRIHRHGEIHIAVAEARAAGFDNINLDLMYALPGQDLPAALADLDAALRLAPEHISHYQLTLEPGTPFARTPPPRLPDADAAWAIQEACQARLASAGYAQYEVSAHARPGHQARHNLLYWTFGDYLGLGAGAHAKLSFADGRIERRAKRKNPGLYMAHAATAARLESSAAITRAELPFEFMLNVLRLNEGVAADSFSARTGLTLETIAAPLQRARADGLLVDDARALRATPLGLRFLNDLLQRFLP
ncbi:MAG: radical SAM family heme chaperone HemW [Metallibacterium scheffleri]|jgi:oxygen-independent coproporphyrinogen-3 oxidase|uniref:radical SAM family heme chaperone HemW n=1 Tax=Metallibacterium scheffleri TaxID=993689 RepID=UPI0026E9B614|nr:radical SAM family heme chaperone HemW [Metallibacterium scheffleri]MCK9366093.1 radical SAM family heme chaperone HemW [Metallibacterium scheffleri]